MHYIILVGDGMADYPLPELNGRTPLEVAFTPSMDEVARMGVRGLFCPIPPDLPPGSDIGNLSLFGYDPHETYTGRASLEAANQGIQIAANQLVFRCNLVTLHEGLMEDFTSGHITSDEACKLVAALNESLRDYPVRFYPGVSYRNLMVVTETLEMVDTLAALPCTPPHDITGQTYAEHLPSGPGAQLLTDLMVASAPVLAAHPVNAARVVAGKPAATSIWLWGQGRAPRMTTYADRYGITGAVISAVDLVRGIGVCAGLEVINVAGATGYLDTNYAGKVAAALEALKRVHLVYIHIEAPDETSHQGRIDLKIRAIEDFDAHVVAPMIEYLAKRPRTRLLVAPDHVTAISTKTHAGDPVPFALAGAGVPSGSPGPFTEAAARSARVLIREGYRLADCMIRDPRITLPTLITPPQ